MCGPRREVTAAAACLRTRTRAHTRNWQAQAQPHTRAAAASFQRVQSSLRNRTHFGIRRLHRRPRPARFERVVVAQRFGGRDGFKRRLLRTCMPPLSKLNSCMF